MSQSKLRKITIEIECLSFESAVQLLKKLNQTDLKLQRKLKSDDANLLISVDEITEFIEPRIEERNGILHAIYPSKLNKQK